MSASLLQAGGHQREIGLRRDLDGEMPQAGGVVGCLGSPLACPDVKPQMVVVPARRHERNSPGFRDAGDVESERTVVEVHRLRHVVDVQMYMAHPRPRRYGLLEGVAGVQLGKKLGDIDRVPA
jgi:hypothetical protein